MTDKPRSKKDDAAPRVKVGVSVRSPHLRRCRIGRCFTLGPEVIEVDADELAQLRADPVLRIEEVADVVRD